MANLYWGGGTGAWTNTNTANWYSDFARTTLSSSVPTAFDEVYFDSASSATAYTCTLAGSPTCRSLSISGPASGNVTIAGSGVTTSIYGNLYIASVGVTRTYTGGLQFLADTTGWTIACGVALASYINFYGIGGWTLTAGLTTADRVVVTSGAFDTAGFSLTATGLIATGDVVRSLSLGASIVTLSNATPIQFSGTNFTFNAGTSTIKLSNATPVCTWGYTFYNVNFTSTTLTAFTFSQVNTFNDLSFVPKAAVGVTYIILDTNQTVNGTLNFYASFTLGTSRYFVKSSTYGTTRIFAANTVNLTDVDFQDINNTGTTWTGTRLGDAGGNSGITFTTGVPKYWNLVTGGASTGLGWALSSGGTPSTVNFPLPQDTMTFVDTGLNTSATITLVAGYNIAGIDCSARTLAMTLATVANTMYGSIALSTAVTMSGAAVLTFQNRGAITITSAGRTWTQTITFNGIGGTYTLLDNFVTNTGITLSYGNFNANGNSLTIPYFVSTGTATRSVTMGSGTWNLTQGSGSPWNVAATGLTLNANTSTIVYLDTTVTARSFAGAGLTYNNFVIGGGTGISILTFTGLNTFNTFSSTKTVAHTIIFPDGINLANGKGGVTQNATKITNWTVTGTAGNAVTVKSSGTVYYAPLWFTVPQTTNINYLIVGYLHAPNYEFYIGSNSTFGSGACSFVFATAIVSTPRTCYWVGGTGIWNTTSTHWSDTSGGTGGYAPPTSIDDAVFNSDSSGASYTVGTVVGVASKCNSINVSAPSVGTFTFTSAYSIGVFGNLTFAVGTLGSIVETYLATRTNALITTNGFSLDATAFQGAGVSTLGSALNSTSGIDVGSGSFDTAGYNVTASTFNSGSPSSTFLRSSIINISGISNPIGFGGTFDAGTSTINISGNSSVYAFNNLTYWIVNITTGPAGNWTINGTNTFNSLNFTNNQYGCYVTFGGNQTFNTDLTFSSNSAPQSINKSRPYVISTVAGTTRTLTFNSTPTLANIDFKDITVAGSAAPISGSGCNNISNCSGITFDAPKTVYYNLASGGNMQSVAFATTASGTPNIANFPLMYDTIVFTDSSGAGAIGFQFTGTGFAGCNIGTVDSSARTYPLSFSANTTISIYGNWINGSGVISTTLNNTVPALTFKGTTVQEITSSNAPFICNLYLYSITAKAIKLMDNLTITVGGITATSVNLNNNTLDCVYNFSSGNIDFGTSGKVVCSRNFSSGGIYTGTPNLEMKGAGILLTTYAINPLNVKVLNGAYVLTISSNSQINNIDFTGFTGSITATQKSNVYGDIILSTGMNAMGFSPAFSGTSEQTITSNGKTIGATTFNKPAGSLTLIGALTTGAFTQMQGAITLDGNTLTTGAYILGGGTLNLGTGVLYTTTFSSASFTSLKTLNFGTSGSILCSGSSTIWDTSGYGLSIAGTNPLATIANNTATAATINSGLYVGLSSILNFNIVNGTYPLNFTTSTYVNKLNFTGYAGVCSGTGINVFGDVILSTGMTALAMTLIFGGTANQTITSNTKTLGATTVNKTGAGVATLSDNFISSSSIMHTAGSLTANADVTATIYASSNSNTRTLTMGSGTWTLTSTGGVWALTIATGMTLNANTSTIVFSNTLTTPRTFAGGGLTYNNFVIGGVTGISNLIFTGSNTFNTISSTKTVAHTILFTAATTTTVANWMVTGTAGNVVAIGSTTPASHNLVKTGGGIINSDYLNISYSNASPINTWYAGTHSTNGVGNTGWQFIVGGIGAIVAATSNFFFMFY